MIKHYKKTRTLFKISKETCLLLKNFPQLVPIDQLKSDSAFIIEMNPPTRHLLWLRLPKRLKVNPP